MGARSHKQHRNQRRRENKQSSAHEANASQSNYPNESNKISEEQERQQIPHLPACVQTLLVSADFAELEEACNDLISYTTQLLFDSDTALESHRRNYSLLQHHHHRQRFYKALADSHIPQRLMSLMSQRKQLPQSNVNQIEYDNKECKIEMQSMEPAIFTKEALYTQIAACSALRTLINNCNSGSSDDEDDDDDDENVIIDALMNAVANTENNTSISNKNSTVSSTNANTECLMELVQSVWQDVEQSAQYYALHSTRPDIVQGENNTSSVENMEYTSDKEKQEEEEEEQKELEKQVKTGAQESKSTLHDGNVSEKENNVFDQEQELEEEEEEEYQDKQSKKSTKLAFNKKHKVKTANKLNFYFVHLRLFDELIQLLTVLVDSSDSIASYFSNNYHQSMEILLHALQVAFTNVFSLVQECQTYCRESVETSVNCNAFNQVHTNTVKEEKYKVAELYASVAIAISELLNVIASSDHVEMQHFFNLFVSTITISNNDNTKENVNVKHASHGNNNYTITSSSSSSLPSSLVEFVKHAIHATELIQWQHTAERYHVNLNECVQQLHVESTSNDEGNESTRCCMNDAKVEMLLYMLCEATINIQSTLMSVTTDANYNNKTMNEENVRTMINIVLPFITVLLKQLRPMEQWQQVLPLLSETCQVNDEEANQLIKLVKHRLHSVLRSLKLFHTIVNTICERNESNEDDEVAFRANPLSADLYRTNSLVVFAETLKNVLWLSPTHDHHNTTEHHPNNNNNNIFTTKTTMLTTKQAQAALTAHIDSNHEASFIQYMLLNIEGAVWDVASTLLLMIPMQNETMNYDQNIWQAMIACVQDKYKLLLTSDIDDHDDDDNEDDEENIHKNNKKRNTPESGKQEKVKSKSMVSESPATRHVLWQHIESIVQLLWTLLRKDMKMNNNTNANNNNNNNSSATHHHIHVKLTDLKLLLALSNFSTHNSHYSSTRLRQALIGTLSLLSKLLGTVESTKPVVECACSLLLHSHVETHSHSHEHYNGSTPSTYTPLLKLGDGIVEVARVPSTVGKSRQQWMSLLNAVDAVVSLRCEAANALIDLFLDERFDATLYGPLQIQQLLRQFLTELRVFIKKRVQLSSLAKRNYRLDIEIANLEQWQELEENLCGFVQYKQQHGFAEK